LSLARAPDAQPLWPDPAAPIAEAVLKSAVRHPLIYRKRVATVSREARPGDWVAVYAPNSELPGGETRLLGYGLYNPRSEIAIRMIRWGDQLPDEPFWRQQLRSAVALRSDLLQLDRHTTAYRVLHAEGDGVPGFVVDRYADVLSGEVFSWGLWQRSQRIIESLADLLGTQHFILRTAPKLVSQEGFDAPTFRSEHCPPRVTITEFGTRFRVDLADAAHKTGFFCDQRDNRFRLAQHVAGRSVLDLCCYTGGFAVQAKKLGGAAEVIGVDLDQEPLTLAQENAHLNQVRVRFVQADVFPYMRDLVRGGRTFDVVVLDPPKLIYSRAEIASGTRAHYDLNRLAMQLVRPGGFMLTCSCAGLLSEEEFLRLLRAAARNIVRDERPDAAAPPMGRQLRILARSGAGPDHPVSGRCPEGEYLKAVWLTLDDGA
jgi:23S rRNA (cytosine1962-C5)-methyltransferase